jgi:hypothetical protein
MMETAQHSVPDRVFGGIQQNPERTIPTMMPRKLYAFILCALAVLLGCGGGGDGGGGNGLNLSRVKVDESRAGKATIGPAGGTITATGANGAVYTFTVPADALAESTEIVLYPVNDLQGQPFAGGMVTGYHLLPDGLQFGHPAVLTVQLPAGTSTSDLNGFVYTGDGQELHLYPIEVSGSTLTFQVMGASDLHDGEGRVHANGGGGGAGLGQANLPAPASARAQAEQRIAAEIFLANAGNLPLDVTALHQVLKTWYDTGIKPDLLNANAGELPKVAAAINNWAQWRLRVEEGPWSASVRNDLKGALLSELTEGDDLAAGLLRRGIDDANLDCEAEVEDPRVFIHVRRALRYQSWAQVYRLATGGHGLDLPKVLRQLCVKVKLETEFPSNLQTGQSGNLRVRAGFSRANGPVKFSQFMAVTVKPDFATDNTLYGGSNQGGAWLDRFYTRAGDQPLQLHVIARFEEANLQAIMAEVYLSSGAGPRCTDLAGTYKGGLIITDLSTGKWETVFGGSSMDVNDTGFISHGYIPSQTVTWLPADDGQTGQKYWTASAEVSGQNGYTATITATIRPGPDGKCRSLDVIQTSKINGVDYYKHHFYGDK